MTFRRHVKGRAATKVGGELFCGGQAKVGKLDCLTTITHQHVFGFEVAMVDADTMTELNGVEQLQKDLLRKGVVADVVVLLCYRGEEIAFRTKLHNDVDAVWAVEDFDEGDDVGVLSCSGVQRNLAGLELLLRIVEGEASGADL